MLQLINLSLDETFQKIHELQHLTDSLNKVLIHLQDKEELIGNTIDTHNVIYGVIITVSVAIFAWIGYDRIKHEIAKLEESYDKKATELEAQLTKNNEDIQKQSLLYKVNSYRMASLSYNAYNAIRRITREHEPLAYIRFSVANIAIVVQHQDPPDHPELVKIPFRPAEKTIQDLQSFIEEKHLTNQQIESLKKSYDDLRKYLIIGIGTENAIISKGCIKVLDWLNDLCNP